MNKYKIIKGQKGGKGGSGRVPVEDPNSLQSNAVARVIILLGEGEVEGLSNADIYKSIYLNEVVIKNDDDSLNFNGVTAEERTGTSTQTYIPGISNVAASTKSVGTEVIHATPIVETVTDTDVDDVRIVLGVQSLYYATSQGDILNTNVEFKIEIQPNSGGYTTAADSIIFDGKCTSAYQRAIRINDLDDTFGAGPWNIKVTRVTEDSTSAKLVNATYFVSIVKIKNRKIQYRNSNIVGLEIDAQQFGTSIPKIAFENKGLKILTPNNRTWNQSADTVTYSGTWDGSFGAAEYCDNPAWIMYDILTNDRYGLGLASTYVDKWTLYNLGVYCDTQVDDGYSDTERRFTFNGLIQSRQDAFHLINMIASSMRAAPYWSAGLATFTQDSPKDSTRLVSAGNVEKGMFNYSGSGLKERFNVVYVTFNDPDDFYRQSIEVVENTDGIARYGYKPIDVVAFGCTSRGQAYRYGKWILESQLEETERIEYTAGFDHIDCVPGEIVDVADPHKSATNRFGGRIVSSTSTSLTIDNAVNLAAGETYSVEMVTVSGVVEKDLTNSVPSSDVTVLTWTGALTTLPDDYAPWILIGSELAPTSWRITGVEEIEKHKYKITGSNYDSTKFARVEQGIYLDAPPYTNIPTGALTAPTDIDAQSFTYIDGGLNNHYYGVTISWLPSTDPRVNYYELQDRDDSGSWISIATPSLNSYTIKPIDPGIWDFRVRSRGIVDYSSWLTLTDYTITTISGVAPPSDVRVRDGGTTWSGTDCEVEWTASTGALYQNLDIDNKIVKGYQVNVYRSSDDELLRTEVLGNVTTYTYDIYKNTNDNYSTDESEPQRGLKFSVYTISIYDETETTGDTETLTNPAPDMTGAPTVTAIFQGVKIDWHNIAPADNDGLKYIVYADTNASPTTQVAEIGWDTTKWVEMGLDTDTSYYAQIEPYDGFGVGTKSSVSDSFDPLKVGTVDIDAELSSSITMTDSLGTTSSGLDVLYDRIIDSGGIAYTNGDWVNYNFGIEMFQEGVRIYTNNAANIFVSYRKVDGSWYYLGGEADHTLDANGCMVSYSTTSGTAQTNYLTLSAGKNVPIFPQGIIAYDCRLHILTSSTLYELVFIREVVAEQIVADNLSAISADLGTIAAGTMQSSNYDNTHGQYYDLDGDEIKLGGNSSPKLHWDGSADTLSIAAVVTFESSSGGYSNISDKPTSLGDVNGTEGTKLTGIATGADVTGDNETFSTESDINVLNTTNAPAAAGADVTGNNTANNASNYTGSAIGTTYTAAKCTDADADQTSSHTANNASNYTGNTIGTNYTSAKCIDANADQTSSHTSSNTSNVGSVPATNVAGWAHASDTTKIDGGDIYTGTVTASQIHADTITANEMAANSINTSELIAGSVTATIVGTNEIIANAANIKNAVITGAKIGNAEVDTLQVAGNAITIPIKAYTGGDISVGTSTVVQQASITSTGSPIEVVFSCVLNCSDKASGTVYLHRNSTELYKTSINVGQYKTIITAALSDTPGSGSHTYYFKIEDNDYITTASNRSVLLLETKK